MSAGSLSAGIGNIGVSGTETFTQSGGTNVSTGINLGLSAGGSGTYNFTGGNLSTNSTTVGTFGTGVFINPAIV